MAEVTAGAHRVRSAVDDLILDGEVVASTASALLLGGTLEGRDVVVKAYRNDDPTLRTRFARLGNHLSRHPLTNVVGFQWLPDAVTIDGKTRSALAMARVGGERLDRWIKSGPSPDRLATVASDVRHLVLSLEQSGLYHGDLEPTNLFVTDAGLALVDLDGCVAAGSVDDELPERGSANFQHPGRTSAGAWAPHPDVFAGVVIEVGLRRHAAGAGTAKWAGPPAAALADTAHPWWERSLGEADGEIQTLVETLRSWCDEPATTPRRAGALAVASADAAATSSPPPQTEVEISAPAATPPDEEPDRTPSRAPWVLAVVAGLAALGLLVALVAARSDLSETREELADTEEDLDEIRAALTDANRAGEQLSGELDDVAADAASAIDDLSAQLDDATSDLERARSDAAGLVSLFPVTSAQIRSTSPRGVYEVDASLGECMGPRDCTESFEDRIEPSFDVSCGGDGCTMEHPIRALDGDVDLEWNGAQWFASGPYPFLNCDGDDIEAEWTVGLDVIAVRPAGSTSPMLEASATAGTASVSAEAQAGCTPVDIDWSVLGIAQ